MHLPSVFIYFAFRVIVSVFRCKGFSYSFYNYAFDIQWNTNMGKLKLFKAKSRNCHIWNNHYLYHNFLFWFAEPARKLSSSIHVELKRRITTYTTTKYLVKSVTIILLLQHSKQVKEMLQHCLVFDSKTTTLPLARHPYWMIDSDLAAPSIQPNKQTYTNQPFEPGQPAISKQATDRSL